MIGKPLAAEVPLGELERVDHRAHGPIQDQDPLGKQLLEQGLGFDGGGEGH